MRKSIWQYKYKQDLLEKAKKKCHYCRRPITFSNMQIDHVIPLSRGGADELTNLVATCKWCNMKKGTKLVEDFEIEIYHPIHRESGNTKVEKLTDILITSEEIRVYGRGGRRIR